MIYYYLLFLLLAAGSITWFVWFLFHKAWQGGLIFSSLNFILLEARFPRILETIDRQQELSALASMEQFYNTLDSVLKKNKGFFQPRPSIIFEIAVSEQNDHIVFYTAVPRWLQKTVERQIQGFFPQAELEWVNDYNIFARPGAFAGSILKLEKSYVLPFETYKTLATNTLAIVTNSVSLISERGEGAAIQILVKPTHFTAKHDARKVIKALTLGRSFGDAVKELSGPVAFLETLDWIFNTLGFKKERKSSSTKLIITASKKMCSTVACARSSRERCTACSSLAACSWHLRVRARWTCWGSPSAWRGLRSLTRSAITRAGCQDKLTG